MSYQYTECGKTVAVGHVESLHRAIGKDMIDNPDPLGPELKFLRVEL